MLEDKPLENILFLDIETVPQHPSFDLMPDEWKKLWEHKSQFLARKTEIDTPATLYPRAGIYAEFGKIICICAGMFVNSGAEKRFRLKCISGDDEKKILEEFFSLLKALSGKKNIFLCAHNGREFDFPYIARRMVINRVVIPVLLETAGKKPWEISHLDTMDMWKFGDFKSYTPLNLLARVLGVPSPKEDMDGSMVNSVYWENKNMEKIKEYCQRDVITVARIVQCLKNETAIPDAQVEFSS